MPQSGAFLHLDAAPVSLKAESTTSPEHCLRITLRYASVQARVFTTHGRSVHSLLHEAVSYTEDGWIAAPSSREQTVRKP